MEYVPLNVDMSGRPYVERFIRHTLEDLYFKDVHAMLRLPINGTGIVAGCNFAITHVLLAAVAGISTSLYRPGKVEPYGGAFTGVLVDFYPWQSELDPPRTDKDKQSLAELLYEEFRGPLTHHLGLPVEKVQDGTAIVDRGYVVKIKRRKQPNGDGLLEEEIKMLEGSDTWPFPDFFQQTLLVRDDAKVLKLERFYWGIRQMVARLTEDRIRMNSAEAFLRRVMEKEEDIA